MRKNVIPDFNGLLEESGGRRHSRYRYGHSFTCTHQDLAVKQGVKMFTSAALPQWASDSLEQ